MHDTTLTRRRMFTGLAASAAAIAGGTRVAAASFKPAGPRPQRFPNLVLTTHEGRDVRFYDDLIKDKIVAINMMFADCSGICPTMTANLRKVQQQLGDRVGRDIHMYSITLEPKHDTPDVLRQYAEHHKVGPGWQFLTGKPADVEVLRRKLGFVDPDPERDRDRMNHIGVVVFGNERFDRWAACPALGAPEQIVKSILWMDVRRKA